MPCAIDEVPTQVLEAICLKCIEDDESITHYKQIDTLRLVSRRWHITINSCPYLWTLINIDFPHMRNLFAINHSGEAPLRILDAYAMNWEAGAAYGRRPDDSKTQGFLDLVVPHLHRWWRVDIFAMTPETMESLETRHAPLLTHILIQTSFFQGQRPFNLFGGVAPKLRSLDIDVAAKWTSPLFRNLSNLALFFPPKEYGPSVHQLLRILEDCPNIEAIVIHDEHGPLLHHEYPTSQGIPLPHLRHLDILAETAFALCLCDGISPTQLHHVHLRCVEYDDEVDDDAAMSEYAQKHRGAQWKHVISFISPLLCAEMTVQFRSHGGVTIDAYQRPAPDVPPCILAKIDVGMSSLDEVRCLCTALDESSKSLPPLTFDLEYMKRGMLLPGPVLEGLVVIAYMQSVRKVKLPDDLDIQFPFYSCFSGQEAFPSLTELEFSGTVVLRQLEFTLRLRYNPLCKNLPPSLRRLQIPDPGDSEYLGLLEKTLGPGVLILDSGYPMTDESDSEVL